MTESFRSLLRSLPDFPASLPPFDAKAAESDPALLFQAWLAAALAAGVPQPHAFSLATTTAAGQPSSRMLILKNIDEAGWHFASSATSRKGLELSENPSAAMNFYWPQLGRQVRVVGSVIELSARASAQDWDERPGADGRPNSSWRLYALQPSEIEFWQASADRNHVRYRIELSK
ncbi:MULTISPECIES: pyridoxamine 5'-phosphate oxidase family protein [Cryobacterium]|uniref:Pyridoxamine 5'-phosphate oxidase n=1 Tax=Cryobacterium glucosi TaxID=1259175 RepID=A0ABY2IJJ6_9MICO|nr:MULTISPECIES: pyridoxamine 5'-phosphate oxidase family protein [Cryobacterium]TFB93793.1 pyridoxamine 5'-phosphate oxidase [Cryobacterium sp. MDB2-A-1]TFC08996.1 pyridoxamine 5'-phosphate oxidase [Cryobacterium sp. MDB2-33-2]TFC14776.1 pyridoxamine 5'-phosphate oxidase [Cryobacterium sp. MDB2-A-2]TFC18273.1 pyridoxamine 5'-phosphate oxidase [Cryobacterium glucosi]TFC19074.1 pyridoxamine 5'-phosphate oxidase [Cryobacterium sp. MDB2-10]